LALNGGFLRKTVMNPLRRMSKPCSSSILAISMFLPICFDLLRTLAETFSVLIRFFFVFVMEEELVLEVLVSIQEFIRTKWHTNWWRQRLLSYLVRWGWRFRILTFEKSTLHGL
jgi:hypothetical protein